jgi:cytochrome c peroxidase
MDSSRTELAFAIQNDPEYLSAYEHIFGSLPDTSNWPLQARPSPDETHPATIAWASMSADEQYDATRVLINVVKSIAAFEATIETPESDFDSFASLYRQSTNMGLDSLTEEQEQGLRLFVGKGNCHFCHSGSSLTNGEFHNIGLGSRDWLSDADTGRYQGIDALRESDFNRQGQWSDSQGDQLAERIDRLSQKTEQLGQYKVPSLRNVKNTAPYMHGGHFETLEEVVEFYLNLDEEAIQGHREELLIEQTWSQEEIDALISFLKIL